VCRYAIKLAGISTLLIGERFRAIDYIDLLYRMLPQLSELPVSAELHCDELPSLRRVLHTGAGRHAGMTAFEEMLALAPDTPSLHRRPEVFARHHPSDPVNIQFTSGTTGFPKGATLSHRNILNNGFFVGERLRMCPNDVMLIPVPLYHCFGLVLGVLGALTHGSTMVLPAESFDVSATLDAIERHRGTILYGVPTMFTGMLGEQRARQQAQQMQQRSGGTLAPAPAQVNTLRGGVISGSVCPEELVSAVHEHLNMHQLQVCYGQTESSPVSFQTCCDHPSPERHSTVGTVHPHLEAQVVDPQSGRRLRRGETGELWVRGYSVMCGYWAQPEKTAEAITADGWLRSGDLCTLDERGFARVVGRDKDMIIRGGENVYPSEVENYLLSHAAVQDVQVVGVPDQRLGEEVCAWVIVEQDRTLDATELRAYCVGELSRYKIPRYYRFVNNYPQTLTGKAQKNLMRDISAKELHLLDDTNKE
jgi:fatty-acyl-CoA synthase